MKKLKVDHDFARLIINGTLRSTWRLYDDKDLSVNDEVELIDKIEPSRPETWRPIGVAVIKEIIEKKLGDIQTDELAEHGIYKDHDDLIAAFKTYYGPSTDSNTVVKMIFFDFLPSSHVATEATPFAKLVKVKIYADGGSRGNPGPSASGYVVLDPSDNVVVDKGVYLGVTTNNQAEYQALKLAIEEVIALGAKEVDVYMDSLLVINQMKGIFKVKNRDLWPINEEIKRLSRKISKITFTHVPRELNKLADAAVNRALDAAVK